MSKLMSRILYFVALPFFLGGILLLLSQLVSSWGKTSVNADEKLGFLLLLVGMLLFTIAWLGALVKMAQLYQRRWFFRLFFGAIFLMTAYIFAGPETAIPPPTDNEDGFLITQWPSYTPYGIQGPPIPRQVWMPKKSKGSNEQKFLYLLAGIAVFIQATLYIFFFTILVILWNL